MKTFVASSIAVLALANTIAAQEACNYSVIRTQFASFTDAAIACTEATGYSIIAPSSMPTAEDAANICSKCPDYVAAITKLSFSTCTMQIGSDNVSLREWFDTQIEGCGQTLTSAASSAATDSSTTVDTNVTVTSSSSSSATAGSVGSTTGDEEVAASASGSASSSSPAVMVTVSAAAAASVATVAAALML